MVVSEVVAMAVSSVAAALAADLTIVVGPFLVAAAAAAAVAGGHDTELCSQVKRLESLSASSNTSSWHHCAN